MATDEARALFVLLSGPAHTDLDLGQALGSALRKAMAALPAPHRPDADLAGRRILIDPVRRRGTPGPDRPATAFHQAVFTDRRPRLRYRHGRDNQKPRRRPAVSSLQDVVAARLPAAPNEEGPVQPAHRHVRDLPINSAAVTTAAQGRRASSACRGGDNYRRKWTRPKAIVVRDRNQALQGARFRLAPAAAIRAPVSSPRVVRGARRPETR
ncbi:hypothetical protein AB0P17_17300 [Streptomyces sp. NPDC088124]|uniref:hypothetical protein n=1 Tax=Streptomyces sp. NPDC088124 TaxID=3154654 RepID=UPI003430243E